MYQAVFYFHNELNDLLKSGQKISSFPSCFKGRQSVKHLIESLGVPHTEVGLILVAGQPQDHSYIVQDGDQVQVYPVSGIDENSPVQFVLDNHLGKLAAYMRLSGLDTWYRNDYDDEQLAKITSQEGRVLLTRDIRLLMRRVINYGYWVRNKDPQRQLVEVLQRYHLFANISPFKRCLHCNGVLQVVEKEEIAHRLQPLTKQYYFEFKICPDCKQIYWKGSHYDRMAAFIEQVLNDH